MKKKSLVSLALGLLIAPNLLGITQVVIAEEVQKTPLVETKAKSEETVETTESKETTTTEEAVKPAEVVAPKEDVTVETTEESAKPTDSSEVATTETTEATVKESSEKTKDEKTEATTDSVDKKEKTDIEFPVTIDVLPSVTIEVGSTFNMMSGVRAYDHVAKKDVTSKVTYDIEEMLSTGEIVSLGTTLDTSRTADYFVKYSIETENGTAFVYRRIVVIEANKYGFYKLEIEDFNLLKNADYQAAIMERLKITHPDGTVLNNSDVDIMIADYYSTAEAGVISVPISVVTEYTTFMEIVANITVVDPAEELSIEASDIKIDQSSEFNALDYAKGYGVDAQGNKVELPVTVKSSNVDTSKEGEYTVVYLIKDSFGNELEKQVNVTVVKKEIIDVKPAVINVTDKVMYVGDKLTEDMILDWATYENAEGLTVGYNVIGDPIKVSQAGSTLLEAGTHQIEFFAGEAEDVKLFETKAAKRDTVKKVITLTIKEKGNGSGGNGNGGGNGNAGGSNGGNTNSNNNNNNNQNKDNNKNVSTIKPTSQKQLPQTGEKENMAAMSFSFGISMLLASFYVYKKRKENEFEL